MKTGTMHLAAALILLFSSFARRQTTSPTFSKPEKTLVSALDSSMRNLSDNGFSGVVLVGRGGSILLHRAYDRHGRSVDKNMAFWLSSNSKQFSLGFDIGGKSRLQPGTVSEKDA